MNIAMTAVDWVAAIQTWLLVIFLASVAGFVLAGLWAARDRGSLVDGFVAAANGTLDLVRDLQAFSQRRLWAIAWHTILESIRRRMLLAVLAVLVVLFMFGGWFLPSRPTEQVKVYVSFVLLASSLIAMVAGGLLACLSLPGDISDKTIHTVVTKPVRRLEIVVGRIIGLTIVVTAILLAMGVSSYVYMWRSVHGSLVELRQKLDEAKRRGDVKYEAELQDSIEQIESRLAARVPVYGSFEFSIGKEGKKDGRQTGYESTYRLFIEGNSPDAAIWHFKNVPVKRLLEKGAIPLEMVFAVFRTTKGEVGRGVIAQITYRNPKTQVEITDYPFEVREYYTNQQTLTDSPEQPLKALLDGSDGELQVLVRCLSSTQYLGMAQPDLYILLDTASFGLNFVKGFVGVWLRVFLIICVAVMFSTFLSTYVAMLATLAVFAGGLCMQYLRDLATGKLHGGGPMEAFQRIWSHENLERPLEPGLWTSIMQGVDELLRLVVRGVTVVLPDLSVFNTAPLVANGFAISPAVLLASILTGLAYAIPFTIVGYFILRSREIAR